ncbi:ABC transporter permease [Salinibacterium hongtaonis]|uniref:ABC transporter permease n=1 Tax=Homoserinimonas hongtaonis TaxID=2079791 RepID=UPI000D348A43|nr:ABC transporter permease subunit [Salinibacterium hongtaonis]AWB89707.1 ABC transporter permease [Salinibacterium hongtaonis]
MPAWLSAALAAAVIIGLWWVGAVTVFADAGVGDRGAIPTPLGVVQKIIEDGIGFYLTHVAVTLGEAAQGFLWGTVLALAVSALVLVWPRLEGVVTQVAVVTYCLPLVAIGPLIYVVIGAPKAGEASGTAIVLAALSVFFTTVVNTLLGLKSADRSSLDIVAVYGGSRFTQLRKVRSVASLPGILSGLQIAVPSAFLGAVLGEWFGGVQRGVGPALIIAAQSTNIERTWALVLISGAVAALGYMVFGLVARFVTPWSTGQVVAA